MPCISGQFAWNGGVIIPIAVASPKSNLAEAGAVRVFDALADTGASHTCISQTVITELKLSSTGAIPVTSASHHQTPMPTYLFKIGFFLGQIGKDKFQGIAHWFPDDFHSTKFNKGDSTKFDVLLGRDILRHCSFKTDLDGHFSLCW